MAVGTLTSLLTGAVIDDVGSNLLYVCIIQLPLPHGLWSIALGDDIRFPLYQDSFDKIASLFLVQIQADPVF